MFEYPVNLDVAREALESAGYLVVDPSGPVCDGCGWPVSAHAPGDVHAHCTYRTGDPQGCVQLAGFDVMGDAEQIQQQLAAQAGA